MLSYHSNWQVRAAAVGNRHLRCYDLEHSAGDVSPVVRAATVSHHAVTQALVEKIAAEPLFEGGAPEIQMRRGGWVLRRALAICKRTPQVTFPILAATKEWFTIAGMVDNPACPSEVVESILEFTDEKFRPLREQARKRLGLPLPENNSAK
jgi:hypothetical protein